MFLCSRTGPTGRPVATSKSRTRRGLITEGGEIPPIGAGFDRSEPHGDLRVAGGVRPGQPGGIDRPDLRSGLNGAQGEHFLAAVSDQPPAAIDEQRRRKERGIPGVALLHLDVRDGRPQRDCRLAGGGEETRLIIQAAGRQVAALGVERQGRHGCGMRQLRRGERPRPDVPDPGDIAAGDRQIAAVGAVTQETYRPRKVDLGRPIAGGEARNDYIAIVEAHRESLAIGTPGSGRHVRQSAGEGDSPLGGEVPEGVAASLVAPPITFLVIK